MEHAQKKPVLAPFRRLQWKLTLSYTLVTVGTILVLELILFGGLIYLFASNLLSEIALQAMRDNIAPQAQKYLEQTPPDLEGLQLFMDSMSGKQTNIRLRGESEPEITLFMSDLLIIDEESAFIVVLDPDLNILAQTPKMDVTAVPGQPFQLEELSGGQDVITNAMMGIQDSEVLNSRLPNGQNLMAVPIEAQNGEVLGAVILFFTLPIWDASTLSPIFVTLLITLIPFAIGAVFVGALFGFLTARGLTKRIKHVSDAADAWTQGDFSVYAQDQSGDELGQLSRRLNSMAEQLQNLLESRGELATLEERNRLARDLHDSVKQQVFATTMQLGAAKTLIQSDPAAAREHILEAEKLARQSQQELAFLIQGLRPAALDDQGLVAALRTYVGDWSQQTEISSQFGVQGEKPLPLPLEQTFFRVSQEALSNIARHSQAQRVDVHLAWGDQSVTLTIQDDGRGLPEGVQLGIGLQSMQERVEALNGRFQLISKPQEGTRVTAVIPVPD